MTRIVRPSPAAAPASNAARPAVRAPWRRLALSIAVISVFATGVAAADPVLDKPPAFAVGDSWSYGGGFASLDHAKAGTDPKWNTTRVVREIRPDGALVAENGKGTRRTVHTPEFNRIEEHRDGKPYRAYKPSWPIYRYPMRLGDSYPVKFAHNSDNGSVEREATVRVVGWETISVPAGTFKTLKVEMSGTYHVWPANYRGHFTETLWMLPEAKMHFALYSYEELWSNGRTVYEFASLRRYSLK